VCWPLVPKFTGSNPAEAVGFLRAKKILSMPSFGGEVKPSVPCRRFVACKRSLNVAWKSTFRQNYRTILAHRVPPFAARGLSHCVDVGEHLVTEAGTSKLWGDPGLHNKPLGCGASEVYVSGPASEEEKHYTEC